MTTGSVNSDARHLEFDFMGNPIYIGNGSRRTWSGGDRVSIRPRRILHPRFQSSQLQRNGQPYVIPAYTIRGVAEPPKLEDHNYSVDYSRSYGYIAVTNGFAQGRGNCNSTNSPLTWVEPPDPWTSDDDVVLVNRLRSKVVGDWNPSQFFAGMGQSLDLIVGSATRISSAMRLIKHGRIGQAAKILARGTKTKSRIPSGKRNGVSARDLANAQLELSYGWLPLVSDAFQGAEYLAQNTGMPRVHKVSVSRKVSAPPWDGSTAPALYFLTGMTAFHRARIILRMTEDVPPLYLSGLTDPLSTAWEALPWSFVADWFIPIGNYLQARAFASSIVGKFCRTDVFVNSFEGATSLLGNYVIIGPSSGKHLVLNRVVSDNLTVPMPVFKPLSTVPGWRRAINAVSLLVQRHGSI